jgi:hypothetical protein
MLNKKPSQKQLDDERKENELQDLLKLSKYSSLIKVKASHTKQKNPPTYYEIEYKCKGYRSPGKTAEYFKVYMTLPADYPRSLPIFQYDPKTPIHHKNIFSSYQGINQYICIGHDPAMSVGLPLREYVIGVGQMIQWRKPAQGKALDTRSLVGKEPISIPPKSNNVPPPPLKKTDIVILDEPEIEINITSHNNDNNAKPLDIIIIE